VIASTCVTLSDFGIRWDADKWPLLVQVYLSDDEASTHIHCRHVFVKYNSIGNPVLRIAIAIVF